MKTNKKSRKAKRSCLPPQRIFLLIAAICAIAPISSRSASDGIPREPFTQEFIITAYYSPLPNQCCYVRGNYMADVALNGEGTHAADSTDVYAGMAAAPERYPFGTRIVLPGIGAVTVHDRGGAITELQSGAHRLDLWVGHGEEGLARALAFGVERVHGTVYPTGASQPAEAFFLSSLPAPMAMIRPFLLAEPDLLALQPKADERSISVEILQKHLKEAGYFRDIVSGWFGPATKKSLEDFNRAFSLEEPSDHLTVKTAAYVVAASDPTGEPITSDVQRGSPRGAVLCAQRVLRYLGFYRGRTNGVYDDTLYSAIFNFQRGKKLVGTETDPGAGRIGPLTKHQLLLAWKQKRVVRRAEHLLALRKIETLLAERGEVLEQFLAEGDRGEQVRRLQKLLADRGFFPKERVSGLFGEVTRDAVLAYQMTTGLVENETAKGAGFVGPATIAALKRDQKHRLYSVVRAEGWGRL